MLEPEPSSLSGSDDLASAHKKIARRLIDAGMAEASVEARRILVAATGLAPAAVLAYPHRPVSAEESRRLEAITSRRLRREPLSRILGEREFYGRTFRLTPAVLDPRPESETLVEAALQLVEEEHWRTRPLRILDVGTGSGCLLVTLLAELPHAVGVGTDVAPEALALAEDNAGRNGVGGRAAFQLGRDLEGIEGPFDLMVSNPPYVPADELPRLPPEVRLYDPAVALDGGPDGLHVYRRLIGAVRRVVPGGWVIFEVGAGQAVAVAAMLARAIGGECRMWQDLGGHTRCVAARTLNC